MSISDIMGILVSVSPNGIWAESETVLQEIDTRRVLLFLDQKMLFATSSTTHQRGLFGVQQFDLSLFARRQKERRLVWRKMCK